jgi:hypothetical protein
MWFIIWIVFIGCFFDYFLAFAILYKKGNIMKDLKVELKTIYYKSTRDVMRFRFCFILPIFLMISGCNGNSPPKSTTAGNTPVDRTNNTSKTSATAKPAIPGTQKKQACLITQWEKQKKSVSKIKQEVTSELLGKLKLGLTAMEVTALLGSPDSKSKAQEEAATGYILSEWEWKQEGVSCSIDSSGKKKTVIFLSVQAPFKGKTTCGIGIGSSVEQMKRVYGKYFDTDSTSKNNYIVGSIYGGINFSIKNNKIYQISIGAFAE